MRLLGFLFLFTYFSTAAQLLQDKAICQALEDKVIGFYMKKNVLCYTFSDIRYLPDVKGLASHGNVMSYREGDETFFRSWHMLDSLKYEYESARNNQHFGVNRSTPANKTFKDYKDVADANRYYAFKWSYKDVLIPDSSLRIFFNDTLYHSSISYNKDFFCLTLSDSSKSTKRVRIYYISKENYRIEKRIIHEFWGSGKTAKHDSAICAFTYYDLPFKKVKEEVNGFVPFSQ